MSNPKSSSQPAQISQPAIPELVSDLRVDSRFTPVIATFLAEFPVLMDRVNVAAKQNDLPGIKTAAHKLKGASGSAGFARLFDLSAQVEDHATHNRL